MSEGVLHYFLGERGSLRPGKKALCGFEAKAVPNPTPPTGETCALCVLKRQELIGE